MATINQKEVVARLVKNGATIVKDCKVVSASVTPMEEYIRVNLGLNKPIKALVTENGKTSEKDVDAVFPTDISLNGALRENEDVAFIIQHLRENPSAYPIIMAKATIDVVQEKVPANTEYTNPFSSDSTTKKFDEDKILSYVVNIRLSDKAKERVEKIENKLLGI